MFFLFTDYGLKGTYIGQIKTVLHRFSPNKKVINLMADAPRNNPKASAYLLASLMYDIPVGSILFCVVDPKVGSDQDKPVIIKINGCWYVGPDNGLFDILMRRAKEYECWKITWRPDNLSVTFHGRDLYAPVCTIIANGETIPAEKIVWLDKHRWPDDLNEIIYIDNFGNAMTGIRSITLNKENRLEINKKQIVYATTFSSVGRGDIFWYYNSNHLIEIAMNQGSVKDAYQLQIGDIVSIIH